jgi:RNA polymerase sigma-70 factor (ECF subfamily)
LPDVTSTDGDRPRFTAMFAECSPRVFAYARRQCDPAVAQDIVADTFLVAWRRLADVPEPALPWLLVVARNQLANRRRGELRRERLADTVARLAEVAASGVDHVVVERSTMLAALAELTELEREAVLLVAWDGLTNRDAARVAQCSVRAFEVRLSRARARLTRALAAEQDPTATKGAVTA